jgi:cytochrome P450 / NADPH-cytochrome P450 reductase
MRACIGRAFAWQEAQLVVAAIIQKFDLSLADPSYTLQLKSALTIKPKDFHIRAAVRRGREHVGLLGNRESTKSKEGGMAAAAAAVGATSVKEDAQVVYVLYGSNSGSSEAFAQRLAGDAATHGKCIFYAGQEDLGC